MLTVSGDRCDRARAQLSLYLDGELTSFEESGLRTHLAECPACRAYQGEVASFTQCVRTTPLAPFETPIVMPRLHRLTLRPVHIGAAATFLAVIGLAGALQLTPQRGGAPAPSSPSVPKSSPGASNARPAYLDSADYERRLMQQTQKTHRRSSSGVPL